MRHFYFIKFQMEKEAFYFPHFCNARHDRKIRRLRKELGTEGYGIYFMLLETLREQQDLMYPLEDLDLLAEEFNVSEAKVRVAICNYGLFEIDEEQKFFSPKMLVYLEPYFKMKEQRKIAGQKSADKRKIIEISTTVQQPFNDRSTKESKGKESKEKESKVNESKIYSLDPIRNELFIKWVKYKKEKKSNYTESGINQLLVDWGNKSNDELEKAINNSISNNYQGLFEPKQQIENGNTTEKLGTSAARMEALRKW
jgi:hypothetical protein